MSDAELDDLMEEDLESKYNPMDEIHSVACIDYEISIIDKVIQTSYISLFICFHSPYKNQYFMVIPYFNNSNLCL